MNRFSIILAAALCLVSCKGGIPALQRASSQGLAPVKVRVQTVSMEPASERHSFVGEVVPSRSVVVSAPHSGRLVSFSMKKGDVVKAGQVIAKISSSTVESAYKIASSNLDQARDGYERATRVYSEGSISEVQYMDIRTKLVQAEAAMESARKALDDCNVKPRMPASSAGPMPMRVWNSQSGRRSPRFSTCPAWKSGSRCTKMK